MMQGLHYIAFLLLLTHLANAQVLDEQCQEDEDCAGFSSCIDGTCSMIERSKPWFLPGCTRDSDCRSNFCFNGSCAPLLPTSNAKCCVWCDTYGVCPKGYSCFKSFNMCGTTLPSSDSGNYQLADTGCQSDKDCLDKGLLFSYCNQGVCNSFSPLLQRTDDEEQAHSEILSKNRDLPGESGDDSTKVTSKCRIDSDCPKRYKCIKWSCKPTLPNYPTLDEGDLELSGESEVDLYKNQKCRTDSDCPKRYKCIKWSCKPTLPNYPVLDNGDFELSGELEVDPDMRQKCRTDSDCPKRYKCIKWSCKPTLPNYPVLDNGDFELSGELQAGSIMNQKCRTDSDCPKRYKCIKWSCKPTLPNYPVLDNGDFELSGELQAGSNMNQKCRTDSDCPKRYKCIKWSCKPTLPNYPTLDKGDFELSGESEVDLYKNQKCRTDSECPKRYKCIKWSCKPTLPNYPVKSADYLDISGEESSIEAKMGFRWGAIDPNLHKECNSCTGEQICIQGHCYEMALPVPFGKK